MTRSRNSRRLSTHRRTAPGPDTELTTGEVASLLISRMAVPVLYFMANDRAKTKTAAKG